MQQLFHIFLPSPLSWIENVNELSLPDTGSGINITIIQRQRLLKPRLDLKLDESLDTANRIDSVII